MSGKSTIPDEVKRYIVVALACYDSPTTVVDGVKEEFGLTLTRQAIEVYDPTKHAGRSLGKVWRKMFEEERAAFKKATSDIPIAQRSFRLRALHRMAARAERMKNYALAAALHEQAAKECGDVYTNRTKIDAKVQATARTVIVPAKAG